MSLKMFVAILVSFSGVWKNLFPVILKKFILFEKCEVNQKWNIDTSSVSISRFSTTASRIFLFCGQFEPHVFIIITIVSMGSTCALVPLTNLPVNKWQSETNWHHVKISTLIAKSNLWINIPLFGSEKPLSKSSRYDAVLMTQHDPTDNFFLHL